MRSLRDSKLRYDDADETDVNRAGGWSWEQVVAMDERFVEAVRRAHPVGVSEISSPRDRERRARSA